MIDLIAQAPDKATMLAFAVTHGLAETVDGKLQLRPKFAYCWWAGSGKFRTKNGTYDDNGDELTAPTFANGVVYILRFNTGFLANGDPDELALDPNDDNTEQYMRSRIVRYIKNNGTSGTYGTINYVELDGVKIYRPQDVEAFRALRGLSGHEWLGGNTF